MRKVIIPTILALFSFMIPFIVYVLTMYRTVAAGDSIEMVTTAYTLGIAHQPGYPLNTFIGFLFKNIPIPLSEVARINLASAFMQSLGVVSFFFFMLELIKMKKGSKLELSDYLASLTTGLIMGFSLIYWEYATKFEVFALNNLFAILLLFISARIVNLFEKIERISYKYLVLYGAIWGLAFGHHQTIVLILPAVLFLFWKFIVNLYIREFEKKLLFRKILVLVAGLFAGLSIYFILIMFIASRNPLVDNSGIFGLKTTLESLIRSQYGTFKASLSSGEPQIKTHAFDQIDYYIKSTLSDFTVFIYALLFIGMFNLFKNSKKILIFTLIGIFMAGFIFLSYAGFSLSSSFGQATARRFFMIPNIFIAILIGFGLEYIFSWLNTLGKKGNYKFGIGLTFIYLSCVFALPLYVNYKKSDNSQNNLAEFYISQAYNAFPKDSIFMYSGDFGVMSADYFKYVAKKEPERIFFSPGRFYYGWYIPKLLRVYPGLDIPVPETGKRFTSVSQIAEANYKKYLVFINPELATKDPTLEKEFTLYPRHYLFEVAKKGKEVKLEDWKKENEDLFKSIDMELIKRIEQGKPSYEMEIIYYLAKHFYESGHVYDRVGLYDEAITEYDRSLKIYSGIKESYAALGLIYGEKIENPDYGKAIQYLLIYRSFLVSGEENLFNATQKKLEEYDNKYKQELKDEEEKLKKENEETKEASESAKEDEN